jgi:hypothetical protein
VYRSIAMGRSQSVTIDVLRRNRCMAVSNSPLGRSDNPSERQERPGLVGGAISLYPSLYHGSVANLFFREF